MADNLQVHMQALELDDEPARQEHAVYLRLAEEQRQAAARLRAVAGEMAAARDLPMGRHDEQTLTSPQVGEAFQRFVKAKAGCWSCSSRWWSRTSGCWPRWAVGQAATLAMTATAPGTDVRKVSSVSGTVSSRVVSRFRMARWHPAAGR